MRENLSKLPKHHRPSIAEISRPPEFYRVAVLPGLDDKEDNAQPKSLDFIGKA